MSDFASLLSSFKQNAASAAAAPSAATSNSSRKRPLPSNTAITTTSCNFPSLHVQLKNKSFNLSFLIIGGQKCGTTWIHTHLQKCHAISLPSQKEVHFWDWHYHKGIDWYIRQFEGYNTKTKYGEITPDYIVLPPTTIAEIHKCFPDLKLIFIARDLVDRAWSSMTMELHDQNMGLNPGEFAEGVVHGEKKRKTVSTVQQYKMQQLCSPSSQPDSYFIERLCHETHTSRSDYAGSLKNWYRYYSEEAILLLDYREIESDPRSILYKIVTHIGVDSDVARKYVDGLEEGEVRRRINASTSRGVSVADDASGGIKKGNLDSLVNRPILRQRMEKYLSPYAASFNSLLKEKKYSWFFNDYKKK